MILLFPSLIKFKGAEERERFRPKMHMFYGQRCVDVRDGLPKVCGLCLGLWLLSYCWVGIMCVCVRGCGWGLGLSIC